MTILACDKADDSFRWFTAVKIVEADRVTACRRKLCGCSTDSATSSRDHNDWALAHWYKLTAVRL